MQSGAYLGASWRPRHSPGLELQGSSTLPLKDPSHVVDLRVDRHDVNICRLRLRSPSFPQSSRLTACYGMWSRYRAKHLRCAQPQTPSLCSFAGEVPARCRTSPRSGSARPAPRPPPALGAQGDDLHRRRVHHQQRGECPCGAPARLHSYGRVGHPAALGRHVACARAGLQRRGPPHRRLARGRLETRRRLGNPKRLDCPKPLDT